MAFEMRAVEGEDDEPWTVVAAYVDWPAFAAMGETCETAVKYEMRAKHEREGKYKTAVVVT